MNMKYFVKKFINLFFFNYFNCSTVKDIGLLVDIFLYWRNDRSSDCFFFNFSYNLSLLIDLIIKWVCFCIWFMVFPKPADRDIIASGFCLLLKRTQTIFWIKANKSDPKRHTDTIKLPRSNNSITVPQSLGPGRPEQPVDGTVASTRNESSKWSSFSIWHCALFGWWRGGGGEMTRIRVWPPTHTRPPPNILCV